MCNLLYPYCALILVLQIMLDAALRNTSWRCSLLDYQACALFWTLPFQVDLQVIDPLRVLCMLDSAAYEEEMRKREADALSRYWLHAIVFQLVAQLYAALCLRVRGPACDACAAVDTHTFILVHCIDWMACAASVTKFEHPLLEGQMKQKNWMVRCFQIDLKQIDATGAP